MNPPASRYISVGLFVVSAVMALNLPAALAVEKLGFQLDKATVPVAEIRPGGPPRDGIPSIDRPRFVPVPKVDYLADDDMVISFTHGNETRAYPLRILVWHEIVNDRIGDLAINVSYCPLCGSGMVFDRVIEGRTLEFGVSGLLYQSDVLMYDRQTESLWSQLEMKAISGPQVGRGLHLLSAQHLSWSAWRKENPDGLVLSTNTGHRRDYSHMPYDDYEKSSRLMFPVNSNRRDLPTKAWIVGLVVKGVARAYPRDQLPGGRIVEDMIGETSVRIRFDRSSRQISVTDADGTPLPYTPAYWFAWQAFHPETTVWVNKP